MGLLAHKQQQTYTTKTKAIWGEEGAFWPLGLA
jgi:hypothetical protein